MLKLIFKPLGCLSSIISSLITISLLVLGIIYLCVHFVLPSIIESQIGKHTYFTANIAQPDSSILDARLGFKDVSIYNPEREFPITDFLFFREISADIDLFSVTDDTIIIESIIIDLERFTWATNKDGESNIQKFIKKSQDSFSTESGDSEGSREFLIKRLTINVSTAQIWTEGKPIKSIKINYNKTFTDISDLNTVMKVLSHDLKQKGLSLIFGRFTDAFIKSGNSSSVSKDSSNLGDKLIESGKKASDTLQKKLKDLF